MRIAKWEWRAPDPDGDRMTASDEYALDDYLAAMVARGLVEQFDTGRGAAVWFTAKPGRDARAVRDKVRSVIPPNWTAERPEDER